VIKAYYRLTKPGIIYGNLITATAGFLLASKGDIDIGLLGITLGGIAFVIASACVSNNYIDRGIDRKMARTKNRALVTGAISGTHALVYAFLLGSVGFLLLALGTNLLTLMLGIAAFLVYVALYGYAKRHSVYGTIIGSIAGALPPVAGYTAASNVFDSGALILFAILTFWQMPHFYAIAVYRSRDYASAKLPVLPVKKDVRTAKKHILVYVGAFIGACAALSAFGYAGYAFLVVMCGLGAAWLARGIKGFNASDDVHWARGMFFFSLIVIMGLSLMLALESLLP